MSNVFADLGQVAAVLGCQWGDEGKGKLVDILSEYYDIIVRSAGGANAGHTIYVKSKDSEEVKKFVFHLVPSGVLHEGKIAVIGNGCVVSLPTLLEEIDNLRANGIMTAGRLFLSDRAHLLFEYHKLIDGLQEELKGAGKVGTTKRGIGPCYADKINRIGIRVGELRNFTEFEKHYRENLAIHKKMYGNFEYDLEGELTKYKEYFSQLEDFIIDTAAYLNKELTHKKKILIEGANGVLLDLDLGTYPFVTSSNPSTGGLFTGSGIAPNKLNNAIGILKAYTTRVGAGPFPTELNDENGQNLREIGGEYGATTGRPRRCGWFDAILSRYALMINGITAVNLTKLDVLSKFKTIKIANGYTYRGQKIDSLPMNLDILEHVEVEYLEMDGWNADLSKVEKFADLPKTCQAYVAKLEELIKCPIKFIGVGQRREQLIVK